MAEQVKVNVVSIETGESVDNLKKLKSEIKKLKSDLLGLDEGSKEYNETLSKLADAQFKLKDIAEKSQRANADFGEVLANVSGLAGAATSAMAGFQGVLQLVGDESEEMQKLTQNIISLMAVAQSFSALEDSIDRIKNLKIALAGATKGVSKLKLALGGLGVGVAITGITILISKLSELNKEQSQYNEVYNDFKDSASDSIGTFNELRSKYNSLGDDMQAKQEFVQKNADAFAELGISITDVKDAEDVFINNSKGIEKALIARAKAEILAEKLKEKFREQAENILEQERDKSKDGWFKNTIREFTDDIAGIGQLMGFNWKTSAQKEQSVIDETNEDIETLQTNLKITTDELNKLNKELGLDGDTTTNESTIKKEIKNLKELREQALVWAETEEELVDENPNIETENDNFKFENLTDNDYYNNAVEVAQAVSDAEVEIAIQTSERLNEIDEQRKAKRLQTMQSTIDGFMMISSSASQLLSAIESTMDDGSKKSFENSKKLQIAQSTISYLQGLISAWSSAMQLGPIAGPIAGATLTGILSATYGVNVSKIKSTKFGGSTSASSTNVPNINSSAINALNAPQLTNARPTFVEGDIENLPQQKVYVLSSEIEDSLNMRKTTIRNSTF